MPQIVNLFLVIVGIVTFGVGLARHDGLFSAVLAVAGIALVAWAYVSDRRRVSQVEQRRIDRVNSKLAEIARAPWRSGHRLEVRNGHVALLFALVFLIGGGWVLQFEWGAPHHRWDTALAGVTAVSIGLLALPRALAGIGHPSLVLGSQGVVTPIHGCIAWREISGVHLLSLPTRGGTQYRLQFRVEHYQRAVRSVHWTERALAALGVGALRRGVVGVPLRDRRVPPEVVHATARFLWKQATGNDYDWIPSRSDEFNAAMQRTAAAQAQLSHPQAVERLLHDPRNAQRVTESLAQDAELIAAESRRQLAHLRLAAGCCVVGAILVVAWPWLRAFIAD